LPPKPGEGNDAVYHLAYGKPLAHFHQKPKFDCIALQFFYAVLTKNSFL
jgi:hypothetical protein